VSGSSLRRNELRAVGNVAERIAEIVVLAEDLSQGNFVRHYLIRAGQESRSIRMRLAPSGRGSGEQYVRERYAIEVALYRNRSSSRKAALVLGIDADVGAVAEREVQLRASLTKAGEEDRGLTDRIALLIAKRNIETWILCLSGEQVDETTDYKRRAAVSDKIRASAEILFDWSRMNYAVPPRCVPSLRRALVEVRRIG
jgi:hypothetical protein